MVPDLIVTGCLFLARGYLDYRKRKDAAVSENLHNSISEGDLAPQLWAVRSYISCSLPSSAPYTFDKFDSSPDRQMSPLCGAAPDPVCWHIKGGIQMTNSCHLLWCYVTWWHPRMTNTTMMRLLRLGQLEMGNKITNFTLNSSFQVLLQELLCFWMCDGVKLSWRCFQIVKWSDNWWYKTDIFNSFYSFNNLRSPGLSITSIEDVTLIGGTAGILLSSDWPDCSLFCLLIGWWWQSLGHVRLSATWEKGHNSKLILCVCSRKASIKEKSWK